MDHEEQKERESNERISAATDSLESLEENVTNVVRETKDKIEETKNELLDVLEGIKNGCSS